MLKGYYGWRIAWTLALFEFIAYGVLYYPFGVLTVALEHETGWTRAQTSLGFTLALLLSAGCAPWVGRHVDRRGARVPMTLGTVAGAALLWAWSRVSSLPVYWAVWLALGLVWSAVFYSVAFTVIAVWFKRERSKAMLLVTLVAGLASTAFLPLTSALNETFGWRGALERLALILLVCAPLLWTVLRHQPGHLGLFPDGSPQAHSPTDVEPDLTLEQARKQPSFWGLTLAFALSSLVTVALVAHLVPLLLERNLSGEAAALLAGLVGAFQLLGRVLLAPLAQKVSLSRSSGLSILAQGLAVGLLLLPGTLALWSFALLLGVSNGALTLARAGLLAERYGSRNYGAISGLMTLWVGLAVSLAPLLAGVLHTRFGGYPGVVALLLACSLLALCSLVWAERHRSAPLSPLEGAV